MENAPSPPLSAEEKRDRLRLIRCENVGPVTYRRLLERFRSAGKALEALPELAKRGGRARPIRICPIADAEREIAALDSIGARLLAEGEPDYPPLLSRIEDAPPLIAARGHTPLLRKAAVAVVGARNASLNGRQFARRLAAELGEGGLLVVSGMARGIDTAAHEGALETGTAAVLGGGVDVVYPAENASLYERILGQGVLISETEPGVEPHARHFPRRNRIISGIARGVVVVEANARSGSLITARFAAEQGREVFAVPGSPLDPRAKGPNGLIRQGATLVESAADVLEVLKGLFRSAIFEDLNTLAAPEMLAVGCEDAPAKTRAQILEYLGPSPVAVDEIIRSGQFSPAVVTLVLLELELANRIERHPGNQVSRVEGIHESP